eukprot:Nitzschia sp. Nitz4//scaffold13_size275219//170546//171454//NITZ4_000888-RA/size275219-processed-gene-0.97-mRNA-1//1//CDS//3329536056//4985//frame0
MSHTQVPLQTLCENYNYHPNRVAPPKSQYYNQYSMGVQKSNHENCPPQGSYYYQQSEHVYTKTSAPYYQQPPPPQYHQYYDENACSSGYVVEDLDYIPPPPPVNRNHPGYAPPAPSVYRTSFVNSENPRDYSNRAPVPGSYYHPPTDTRRPLSVVPETRSEPRKAAEPRGQEISKASSRKGQLQELDIVCGRGAPTNYHYGNQVFQNIVQEYQTSYLCAKRSNKPRIALEILDRVRDTGARFVRREKTAGQFFWVEIEGKGAYEKVCQALREGAPDLQRKMLSTMKKRELGAGKTAGPDKEN